MKLVKTKSDFSLCIMLEMFMASGIAIFTIVGQYNVASFLFTLTFILLILYCVKDLFLNKYEGASIKKYKFAFILILLCCVNVLLDLWFEKGKLSFDYLKKLIMFCSFIILLNYAIGKKGKLSAKTISIIQTLPVVVAFLFVISYYIFGNKVAYAGGITLGFSNPNFTALWILHLLLFTTLFIIEGIKKKNIKIIAIVLVPFLIDMMLKTKARACMLAVVVFVAFMIFGIFKRRLNKVFVLTIAAMPLIVAILYLIFVDEKWFNELFSFVVSEGKTLDSRVKIWKEALSDFIRDPILGSYYAISDGAGASQMHNTHIDVLCSYGIVPAVMFIKLLYDSIRSCDNKNSDFYCYACISAFCTIIFVGSFEAAIVSGSAGLNIMTIGLLLLAHNSADNPKNS